MPPPPAKAVIVGHSLLSGIQSPLITHSHSSRSPRTCAYITHTRSYEYSINFNVLHTRDPPGFRRGVFDRWTPHRSGSDGSKIVVFYSRNSKRNTLFFFFYVLNLRVGSRRGRRQSRNSVAQRGVVEATRRRDAVILLLLLYYHLSLS